MRLNSRLAFGMLLAVTLRFGGLPEKEDYDKPRHPIVLEASFSANGLG